MHHLGARQSSANGPERAHVGSDRHLPDLRGIEVQEPQHEFAAVIAHRDAQLAAPTINDIGGDDFGFDLLLRADRQISDWRDACLVLIAQRQVQHEVPVGLQPGPREFRRDRRALRGFGRRAGTPGGASRQGNYSTRIASTSNCAPLGRLATPTVERAG